MSDTLKNFKYDKRMLSWNLKQKLITQKEYDEHLNNLEDLSHLVASESENPEEDQDQTTANESAGSDEAKNLQQNPEDAQSSNNKESLT